MNPMPEPSVTLRLRLSERSSQRCARNSKSSESSSIGKPESRKASAARPLLYTGENFVICDMYYPLTSILVHLMCKIQYPLKTIIEENYILFSVCLGSWRRSWTEERTKNVMSRCAGKRRRCTKNSRVTRRDRNHLQTFSAKMVSCWTLSLQWLGPQKRLYQQKGKQHAAGRQQGSSPRQNTMTNHENMHSSAQSAHAQADRAHASPESPVASSATPLATSSTINVPKPPFLLITALMHMGARSAAITMSHGNAFERATRAVGGAAIAGLDIVELGIPPKAFDALRKQLKLPHDAAAVYDLFPVAGHLKGPERRIAGQFLAADALWTLEEQGLLGGVPLRLQLERPKGWNRDPKEIHASLLRVGALEISDDGIALFRNIKKTWDALPSSVT